MFDVQIRALPSQRLATIAHKGPYTGIGQSFEKLFGFANSPDLQSAIGGIAGVYFDDPSQVAEADLTSAAGFIVSDDAKLPAGLEETVLQAGDHAVLTYKGPYEETQVAYDHLFGHWLPNSKREPDDAPCFERYLNNPADTKPEDLLTEICLPLK